MFLSLAHLHSYLSEAVNITQSYNIYVEDVQRRIRFQIGPKLGELDFVKNKENHKISMQN